MDIRESQIESVFVTAPVLTKDILHLNEEPRLLARQMIIPSGRLDLLYAYQTKLLLVELKVVPFHRRFIRQVLDYRSDLIAYQERGSLLRGEIIPYLLCPSSSIEGQQAAAQSGVSCIDYDPEQVLQFFYRNFKPVASFVEVKPVDLGIWNLHLLHKFIYLLEGTDSMNDLRDLVGGSSRTLYNKIRFASELRLVNWTPSGNTISLTELGRQYVKKKDVNMPERLSEAQVELLRKLIMKDPFESPVILGIASIVEAVFALAKNTYPIPMTDLMRYFSYFAGKHFDWQTEKAKYNATHMYSNYAVDLGLLARSGEAIYLTPEGFRFTVQMQLHKSLRMVDSFQLANS